MSRILRRPKFRGGKVIDSRGTGITSGLMDGGRVGFRFGGRGAGPTFNPFAASQIAPGQLGGQISRAAAPAPDYSFLDTINISEFFEPVGIKGEGFKPRVNPGKVIKSQEEIEEENEELKSQQVDTGDFGDERLNVANLKRGEQNLAKSNEIEEPEISAEDAIRENAKLFADLLGEASEEDLKKGRIADASNNALIFFEETVGKGKGIKEAAGGVAGFALGRESETDKAKAAIRKTDQTGVALAINDYIAGKRSKENLKQLLAKTKFGVDYGIEAAAAAKDLTTKEWPQAVALEADSLKENVSSNKVIKNALYKKFGKPAYVISGFENDSYSDIDTDDLKIGFNIISYAG